MLMDKSTLARDMRRFVGGASFINQKKFADYMGVSRGTAKAKLANVEKIDNVYYFIPDVVDEMLRQRK